ncbi:lysine/arginine/ornithine transport system substrate-binding protein [Paraburkholderia sp. BL23I1N1]|nr:lysine/arginine/ornithine transport system substrate-binding protein [Paraburkholderia sp. BL23I1N1]
MRTFAHNRFELLSFFRRQGNDVFFHSPIFAQRARGYNVFPRPHIYRQFTEVTTLGNEICTRLKAKCVWVENDFDGLIPGLKARKFDGVLSSMTITAERAEQIAFSSPLFETPTALVARKGSGLHPTVESLKGRSVGVEQGTIQETYAKRWEANGVKVVSYQNQDQVYQDLEAGRIDAALQDQVQAELGFLKMPRGNGYALAGEAIPSGAAAIGLRKADTDLKADIDKAIDGMMRDGAYKKIEKKYFDFDIAPRS